MEFICKPQDIYIIKEHRRYFLHSGLKGPDLPGVLMSKEIVWKTGPEASLFYCQKALIISCNAEGWALPFHLAQYIETIAFNGLSTYGNEWYGNDLLLKVLSIKFIFPKIYAIQY